MLIHAGTAAGAEQVPRRPQASVRHDEPPPEAARLSPPPPPAARRQNVHIQAVRAIITRDIPAFGRQQNDVVQPGLEFVSFRVLF